MASTMMVRPEPLGTIEQQFGAILLTAVRYAKLGNRQILCDAEGQPSAIFTVVYF
jgi:hypothetical protein